MLVIVTILYKTVLLWIITLREPEELTTTSASDTVLVRVCFGEIVLHWSRQLKDQHLIINFGPFHQTKSSWGALFIGPHGRREQSFSSEAYNPRLNKMSKKSLRLILRLERLWQSWGSSLLQQRHQIRPQWTEEEGVKPDTAPYP